MNLQFSLCNEFKLSDILSRITSKGKKKKSDLAKVVIHDINERISNPEFDKTYISNHILNKLIQLTCSEYGILGKVVNENELHAISISNVAWDAASFKFYNRFALQNGPFIFSNAQSLFSSIIDTKKPVIINKYDNTRHVLPNGHPDVKRFIGVPILIAESACIVVGLCNKITKYTKQDIENIKQVLNTFIFLFIA